MRARERRARRRLGRAFLAEDPDGNEPTSVATYCPVCAAAEFGYPPDIAATYVCAWEPLTNEVEST
jgi:hypothetical protein